MIDFSHPYGLCAHCAKPHDTRLPCVTDTERVARVRRWLLEDGTPSYLLVEEDVFALLRRIDDLVAEVAELRARISS